MCCVRLNRYATFSKAPKSVEGCKIKFELDPTFARLPHDFSFVLKKGLKTIWTLRLTFVRPLPGMLSKFVKQMSGKINL